jgi:hypothetical protein
MTKIKAKQDFYMGGALFIEGEEYEINLKSINNETWIYKKEQPFCWISKKYVNIYFNIIN